MRTETAKRILVVEDDWHLATALGARLRIDGYDVLMAPGPSAASVFAQAYAPDLVITDFQLPVTDGLTLVQQLRDAGYSGIPFIVITGCRGNELRKSAAALGAVAYFEKPYDPARLMQAVAGALKSANSSQPQIQ